LNNIIQYKNFRNQGKSIDPGDIRSERKEALIVIPDVHNYDHPIKNKPCVHKSSNSGIRPKKARAFQGTTRIRVLLPVKDSLAAIYFLLSDGDQIAYLH